MAVATNSQLVSALYVAVFNRAPDQAGLTFWTNQLNAGASYASIANGFAQHEVFTTGIGALGNSAFVSALYTNILGSAGDTAGIAYWTARLAAGETKAAITAEFVKGSLTIDIPALLAAGSISAADAAAATTRQQSLTNKADVGINFANTLGTKSNLNAATISTSKAGLEADPIYKAAQAAIANVNSTAASKQTAIDAIAVAAGSSNPAQSLNGGTYTLTTGVDTLVGGGGNDTFVAGVTDGGTPTLTFTGLDSIDGGAGIDTLKIDFATLNATLPTSASIKNIEILTTSSTGTTILDVTPFAGMDTVNVVGGTTVAVTGGKTVSVVGGTTATLNSDALTTASISKSSNTVAVNNTVAGAGTTGTTLTAVTLDAVTGATAALGGNAIATVSVTNQKAALAATVTNATSTALTVNTQGSGYDAAGAAVVVSVAAGAAATAVTVNATGAKSNLTVSGAKVSTVNITGTADLTLAAVATATTIDGSAATGGLTLGTLNAVTANVKTGAGNDSFTLAATGKATVDTGAGNDTVTLASALIAGSTVNLGAGNDKFLFGTGGSVATSTTTVIDGGAGIDTVGALLINAGNAAQFKNFDLIDVSGNGTATVVDAALLTGSTITGTTLSGGTGAVTLNNVTTGTDLTVSGASTGTTTLSVLNALTNTADVFGIKFDGAAVATAPTAANVTAGTVVLANVETVNVTSGGATNTWNSLTLTADAAKSVVVTGSQNLDLSITAQTVTLNKVALTSIDGSAATGKLTITENSALHTGSALTIKGGSAADTIVLGASGATVTGGAGNDVFNVTAATSNVTAGVGAAAAADIAGTLVKTTITDFIKGDSLVLGTTVTSNTFSNTKVDVSAAQNLGAALDLAAAGAGTAATALTKWFTYGADTYIVQDKTAGATLAATDTVIKLNGVLDLSTSTLAHDAVTNVDTLTYA